METVVVTATGFEQKITDAPASISVMTQDDIRSRAFTTLLDAVKYQEGVDIGSTRDKTDDVVNTNCATSNVDNGIACRN